MTIVVGSVVMLDWLEKRKNIMGELDRQLIQSFQNPGTGLTLDQLQLVTEHSNPFKMLAEQAVEEVLQPAVPAVGEAFELTLDGDAPENQPLQIVRDCGYTGKWRHNGRTVQGKQTRRFKLAQVGYQPNLDGVKSAFPTSGSVEGQWIKAFKAAYPQPDGNGPIGIADASWVYPNGGAGFPIVGSFGDLDFHWAGDAHGADWRWLVPAE